jgi:hypothetical protein
MSKFIFDGINKKIIMRDDSVVNGVVSFSINELWSEWCDWLVLDDNLKYAPAFESLMVPLSATEFVGPYLFMRNDLGWRGIPPSINPCTIIIQGSFFGKDPNAPLMENLEAQATDMIVNRSVLTNTVVSSGIAGPTAESIAAATVQALANRIVENGMTSDELTRLMASVILGKLTGAGTGTERFRDLADTKDRIIATINAVGDRTEVLLDPS